MKKVLISGMTASQSSFVYSERSVTFIGSVARALRDRGIVVDWQVPSMDRKVIDSYDHVLIGVAPILSLAANRAFSALSLIESLWDTDKLTLFIDAPEPSKIHASLRSANKNPESLTKTLYSRRPGYTAIATDKAQAERINSIIEALTNSQWKKTLVPVLPWSTVDKSLVGLPKNITSSCVGINVDSLILEQPVATETVRYNQWLVENENTKWIKHTSKSLVYPNALAKSKRTQGDASVLENMRSSAGVLVGPHDDKVLWWSSRFAQAMNTRTPVATEWRESSTIGDAWSHLASGIEEMDIEDRYELSTSQRMQYIEHVPHKEKITDTLLTELGLQ
jgi:hypothetical protein